MMQKILLAIGDYGESEEILESGLVLAKKNNAQILFLHVLDPLQICTIEVPSDPVPENMLTTIDKIENEQFIVQWQECQRRGIEYLQSYVLRAKHLGLGYEISQNFGDPGQIICEQAKKWSADTIVMGRNQKSMLSEIFLGSVSNYVLHHAPCSVMVIQ